jgi:hypothetical protein
LELLSGLASTVLIAKLHDAAVEALGGGCANFVIVAGEIFGLNWFLAALRLRGLIAFDILKEKTWHMYLINTY